MKSFDIDRKLRKAQMRLVTEKAKVDKTTSEIQSLRLLYSEVKQKELDDREEYERAQ